MIKTNLELDIISQEKWKKQVDEDKKEIEGKMRERDLLNKDVVTAEEKERLSKSEITTLQNEYTKLQNRITGYKTEAEKL